MQPTVHVSAIRATELFRPREIRELSAVHDADILRTVYVLDAENGINNAVIDLEENIGNNYRENHEPNKRRGNEIAQNKIPGPATFVIMRHTYRNTITPS